MTPAERMETEREVPASVLAVLAVPAQIFPGVIFNSAADLREHLARRALAGDREAIELLLGAVPLDLPERVLQRSRDAVIAAAGAWLLQVIPGITRRRLYALLEAAGDAAEGRAPRGTSPLMVLAEDDRSALVGMLAPVANLRRSWPRSRTCRTILKQHDVGRVTPLESAHRGAPSSLATTKSSETRK